MIDISVKNLVKSYDVDVNLIDGLSFDIQEGERVAILGRNGAGKSTLFKILTGEIDYDTGEINIAPGKRMGLISQIPHYPPEYTVEDVLRSAFRDLQNIKKKLRALEEQMAQQTSPEILRQYDDLSNRFTAGGGYEMDVEADKTCNGLGIPSDMRERLFCELSGGEKTRVNLARLLLEKTDILLLDEPTNHLDLKSVEWLEDYILRFKGTVLAISHDRYFLDRVIDRVIELRGGRAEFYSGNYSFYVEEKQARYELQLKQYEQEQAKLKQLGYTVERMKGWGINNRSMYRRAMSIQHRMERIEKTERPQKEQTLSVRFAEKSFHGDEVLKIKDLSKKFGDRTLFSTVNLLIEGGQRIAFLGDNGTGKSTFLKIILGEEPPTTGRLRFGPSVKWAYLPQIIHFAHPERSLLDTMLYEKNCTTQMARDRLGSFMFRGEDVFKPVSSLSGGIIPSAARIETAIGRSKEAPFFRSVAGARFTMIFFGGSFTSAFRSAVRTRSAASFTSEERYPTICSIGSPLLISASTRIISTCSPWMQADVTQQNAIHTPHFQNIIREHRPKRPTEQKKSGTPSETARRHPFRKDNNIIAHLPRSCQSGTG